MVGRGLAVVLVIVALAVCSPLAKPHSTTSLIIDRPMGAFRPCSPESRCSWDPSRRTCPALDKTFTFTPTVLSAMGSGATLHLTERFRRVANDMLLYEYTVNDPATFTRPFTVAVPMRRGEAIFEYACHEANYFMEIILRGGRVEDRAK
jgi:hypothetical protein